MKAIVVEDGAAGAAGMRPVDRSEPEPAIDDVVVAAHPSGFVGTEVSCSSDPARHTPCSRTRRAG